MSEKLLQELIKEGENIYAKLGDEYFFASPFSKTEYEIWLQKVLGFTASNAISPTNPLKSYISRMWSTKTSTPTIYSDSNSVVYSKKTIPTYSLMDFMDIVARQIDFLKKIEVEKTITIKLDGLITNQINGKFYKYKSTDKVFKMITTLAMKETYVNTSSLIGITGYDSANTLAKGKRDINKLLLEKLEIKDFIIGQRNSGYRINSLYLIEIIT